MEIEIINDDIEIYCITAESFPDGIFPAFQKLHSLVPFSELRNYISISRPENGGNIVYRAGATEISPGDFLNLPLEKFVIQKGEYYSETIENYRNDLSIISKTFEKMIGKKNIDPTSYCVEWYISEKDMKCLVKIK